ncbi:DUF6191 domain-containing protein [Streptomyces sp. AcE210]|uniref:DUF6191 domain-containing protein n=1 Tax=Streptomyces sp. AcE210 TaxID=2292703 RepID=UPI000E309264|nr:DUF6191 domain-containing protein [Streptomyces sp. AcE210]RFC72144.1 hypothetical protein DXZ75_34780 [Streptomyces sp. AcE210]
MFNMFEELFSPGRKHTNEERKRLELTRVDLNDGDPGRGPIDLTSGKVVVRIPAQSPPDLTNPTDPTDEAQSGESAHEADAPDLAVPAPSDGET